MSARGIVLIVLALVLGAAARTVLPAGRADAAPLAMGPGMMGGYKAGMDRGDGSRGSSQTREPDSRGARLYAQSCGRCHALPDPRVHTARQWPAVVSRMTLRMWQAQLAPLSREQVEEIDAYLERHAAVAP